MQLEPTLVMTPPGLAINDSGKSAREISSKAFAISTFFGASSMHHNWVHILHMVSHAVTHFAGHGKKHDAGHLKKDDQPSIPAQCSRCNSTHDIRSTNCCGIYLCTSCINAWHSASLQQQETCVICSKSLARQE
ncbi:MAG: hypothetical protein R3C18_09045 [Planctomycetaceae bacterium]